ncbi:MAG TPA: phosphoribosylamine--glycine ligase [Polyangiaceae bacterium]|nr:phosphoribosylamine--glycine ligase [Polyangiaceae bacterium]
MGTNRRIMVIGAGGREHALALRLVASESVGEVIVCPGNPGTESAPPELAALGKVMRNVDGDPIGVATAAEVDLAVIGPEAPLCAGLADRLVERGVICFGPSELAARLEGSKEFMKSFAERHGIRTARHVVVRDPSALDAALARFDEPPVVKADGLCAGKGVVVARDFDEAREAALGMLVGQRFGPAGTTLVLEERLAGFETSVHAICDGERFIVLPPAQDHKRLMDGDRGPNTGGMGTFAPTPRVSSELMAIVERDIIARAVAGMARDGCPFRGCLFAGLMISPQGEPVLLEFNVRFGDPETQVLMGLIDGDFAEILGAAAEGRLTERVAVRPAHALCVVLAARGYPDSPRKGDVISGLAEASAVAGVHVYHAGTRREGERVVTAGGRVLGVTAVADSMKLAREHAYRAVGAIEFAGKQWREDIGLSVLDEGRGES